MRIPQHEASLSAVFEREQILSLSTRILRPHVPKEKLNVEVRSKKQNISNVGSGSLINFLFCNSYSNNLETLHYTHMWE